MQVYKKRCAIALAAAIGFMGLGSSTSKASTIAAWNFENDAIAVNNSPAPSTGTGTAAAIGMGIYPTPNDGTNTDDVLLGKSSDTGTNGVADLTQVWRVRAQGTPAANGWSSLAPIGTQGATFSTSTVGDTTALYVSFDWYSTTQGEANLELAYTTNGGTSYTNVPITLAGNDGGLAVVTNSGSDTNTVTGSYVSDNLLNNGSMAGQDWFTSLQAQITDPLALNNANFGIELVNASTGADDVSTQGTALNNNSGNWRFDNIVISSTPIPVPEPASVCLLGIGAMGLLARRRRRA
jgi:PEP-CTERM motif